MPLRKRRRYSRGKSAAYSALKRLARRRYRYVSRASLRGITQGPLPNRVRARHLYQQTIECNPTAAAVAGGIYSANGMTTTLMGGGGHQPLGFDQMTQMYDHYIVVGSKISIRSVQTDAQNAAMFVYVTDDTSSVLSAYQHICEVRSAKTARLVSNQVARLTKKINPLKFLGSKKKKWDDEVKGSVTANPAEGVFFVVGVGSIDAVTDPTATLVEVRIEYSVIWIEPKKLGQS